MGTLGVVASVIWALGSVLTAILIWRRWTDEPARLLKWAILLWPCAGGLFGSIGLLLISLRRSGTLEVIAESLGVVMLIAIATHLCFITTYIVGRLTRHDGRGTRQTQGR